MYSPVIGPNRAKHDECIKCTFGKVRIHHSQLFPFEDNLFCYFYLEFKREISCAFSLKVF
jgi:hypothetical protein